MTTAHNSLIFISHASADKEAVALTDFLMHLFKLDTSDIVCSSSPGNGLCNGAQSYPEIERQIRNSAVVIFLLSRAYCESDDCKMETSWGHSHSGRFIIHLESVRSSNKPKLLDSLSMNNWDRIGIAALAEHVKDKLNKTYSLLDWEREIEKLDFTGYQTQKENSDAASVQENSLGGSIIMGNVENNAAPIMLGNSAGGNHAAAVVRKKQEQIKQKNADLIKCYNEQLLYVKVKIKSRLAGAICAPGAKIYLSTEEALQLEKKGIVEIMPLRVYAVQIIKSFTNYPTRYQVGQLMPLNENTANKWIKQGVAKIVFSVEDLL